MQSILNFWLLLFWFSWLLFFLNTTNLIKLFVTSELIWLILYIYSFNRGCFYRWHLYVYTIVIINNYSECRIFNRFCFNYIFLKKFLKPPI